MAFTQEGQEKKKSAKERAYERIDLNYEMNVLEAMLGDLKVMYEQFFMGIVDRQPESPTSRCRCRLESWSMHPLKTLP